MWLWFLYLRTNKADWIRPLENSVRSLAGYCSRPRRICPHFWRFILIFSRLVQILVLQCIYNKDIYAYFFAVLYAIIIDIVYLVLKPDFKIFSLVQTWFLKIFLFSTFIKKYYLSEFMHFYVTCCEPWLSVYLMKYLILQYYSIS